MLNGILIKTFGILVLGMSLCIALIFYKSKPISPDVYDAGQHVTAAYNIFHHGIFSERVEEKVKPSPQMGREPFYSLILSSILHFEPAASGITVECLSSRTLCPETAYIHGKWLNSLLFSLSGAAVAILGLLVSRNLFASTVAGLAIWANFSAHKNMLYMVSDPLALALSSFLALTLYLAVKRGHIYFWGAAGLLLAFLTLTKAIFLYCIPLLLFILLLVLVRNKKRQSCALRISICVVFIGCLSLPLHSWMKRNQTVSDQYVITMLRGGIALNTRDRLNDMTWPEYTASFIYWIRGSGDAMAAHLFPKRHWNKLRVEHPDGYYLTAQRGYPTKVREVMANRGVSQPDARNIVDKAIIANILERPLKHLVVNIAVFWRGIWVDEFIIFSLPGLISLIIWATRNGNLALIMALTPSLFNLLIYPTISLNIPRYQITALPALSLGTMFTIIWMVQFFRRRWGNQ